MVENKRLVFIHGFLENAGMWNAIISGISKRNYKLDTPELPGHGKNLQVPEQHHVSVWCKNILDQLDIHADERVFIIAHSMGGYLASSLVEMLGDQVSGLCLFHSKAGADHAQKIEDRKRAIDAAKSNKDLYVRTMINGIFYEKTRTIHQTEIEKQISYAQQLSVEAVVASQEVMISRPDQIGFLKRRNFPLFYFLGENDTSIPLDVIQNEIRNLPGALAHIEPGIGHMGHIEATKSAISFIQRILHTDQ
jgi:pimeloyl-ACP methyl ester carboxylesterase